MQGDFDDRDPTAASSRAVNASSAQNSSYVAQEITLVRRRDDLQVTQVRDIPFDHADTGFVTSCGGQVVTPSRAAPAGLSATPRGARRSVISAGNAHTDRAGDVLAGGRDEHRLRLRPGEASGGPADLKGEGS
jgi:hypothetical protein